ncbi:MAG: outer membrane lipoprotein LolB [Thiothrix sp.]|nr:MAG: outer membrane lipoprotein LolB [Thiothrix sp.]
MLALFILFSCATSDNRPRPAGKTPRELAVERKAGYKSIDEWDIRGRIGVKQGDDGFSAGFKWVQQGNTFDIKLFDPIGRQVAWLRGDDHDVSLDTAKGEKIKAQDPEQLLLDNLGWTLPIRSLLYWVKGLPDPATIVWQEEYDEQGRMLLIRQADWSVRFEKYLRKGNKSFPKLTRLEHQGFKMKLLVQDWQSP